MRHSRLCICPNGHFHPKGPRLPLLPLAPLRVSLSRLILPRRRRLNETGIHHRPLLKPQPLPLQMTVDLRKQSLPQLVLLQQMAEVQDRGLVRQRLRQPQAHQPSHRLHLVEQVLHSGITQVVEQLHAVDPQHGRQLTGPAPPARLGIEGSEAGLQLFPGNQTFHPLQKDLPAGLALPAFVFQVCKGWLPHGSSFPPHLGLLPCVTVLQSADLFRGFLCPVGRHRGCDTGGA